MGVTRHVHVLHARTNADQLRPALPKLAALMDESETDVLAYMAFPAARRAKLHLVNPLERLNGASSSPWVPSQRWWTPPEIAFRAAMGDYGSPPVG